MKKSLITAFIAALTFASIPVSAHPQLPSNFPLRLKGMREYHRATGLPEWMIDEELAANIFYHHWCLYQNDIHTNKGAFRAIHDELLRNGISHDKHKGLLNNERVVAKYWEYKLSKSCKHKRSQALPELNYRTSNLGLHDNYDPSKGPILWLH